MITSIVRLLGWRGDLGCVSEIDFKMSFDQEIIVGLFYWL
jgi:hypothetical protein